jgi:hypothetical protein
MNEPKIEIDLLHQVESLTQEVNSLMQGKGRTVLARYPLTFSLLALFGVIAVGEGAKGVLAELGIFDGHPVTLLVVGLVILVFTGTLYKKLDDRKPE